MSVCVRVRVCVPEQWTSTHSLCTNLGYFCYWWLLSNLSAQIMWGTSSEVWRTQVVPFLTTFLEGEEDVPELRHNTQAMMSARRDTTHHLFFFFWVKVTFRQITNAAGGLLWWPVVCNSRGWFLMKVERSVFRFRYMHLSVFVFVCVCVCDLAIMRVAQGIQHASLCLTEIHFTHFLTIMSKKMPFW